MKAVKRWLLARVEVYRDFPQYFMEVKNSGWEMLWGPAPIAILFSIYAVIGSMGLSFFLLGFALACIVAGYLIWRPYYQRFSPRLCLTKDLFLLEVRRFIRADNGEFVASEPTCFIQVQAKCLTEKPVCGCTAQLRRIRGLKDGQWIECAKESLKLTWSPEDTTEETIYPEIPRRLNVAWVTHRFGFMPGIRGNAQERFVFSDEGPLRFDIVVFSQDYSPVMLTVEAKVSTWGNGERPPELEGTLLLDEMNLQTCVHHERLSEN